MRHVSVRFFQSQRKHAVTHRDATSRVVPSTAVRVALSQARQIARREGEWRRRTGAPPAVPPSAVSTESPEAELRRLRKENRELQARCEILKNGGHFQQPIVERYGTVQR